MQNKYALFVPFLLIGSLVPTIHAGETDLVWYVCSPQIPGSTDCRDSDGPINNGGVTASINGECVNSKLSSAEGKVTVVNCQTPVMVTAWTSVSLSTPVDSIKAQAQANRRAGGVYWRMHWISYCDNAPDSKWVQPPTTC